MYNSLINKIQDELAKTKSLKTNLNKIVVDNLSTIPYFNWTGIYLLDSNENELVLDYYIGKPTEHTNIPVGKGVCGSAVADHEDKIIKNVTQEENYLACSLETRSEIVVLIENQTRIFGQIDVDSDEVGAFDEIDRVYLRKVSEIMIENL